MDKFGRIKKVMVDKPVFKLADPNNPVHYQTKPTPEPIQKPQAIDKRVALPNQRPMDDAFAKEKVMAAVKSPYEDTPSSIVKNEDVPQRWANESDPQHAYQPKHADEKPDDDALVKANVEEILMSDGTDAILDALTEIEEYEMSPRDTRIAHDRIYKYLLDNGLISEDGSDPNRKL